MRFLSWLTAFAVLLAAVSPEAALAKAKAKPAPAPAADPSKPPQPKGSPKRAQDDEFLWDKIGPVWIYKPQDGSAASSLVIFISGDDGWGLGQPDMADRLTKQGALVAAIDIIAWMKVDLAAKQDCLDISGELNALAQEVIKRYALPATTKPILYGFSSGALMVYVGLAQSAPHIFNGAVSLGFCNDLWLNVPVCVGNGLHSTFDKKHNRTLFDPAPGIQDRWAIINGDKDPYCKIPTQQAFAAQVPGSVVHAVKGLTHGFGSGDWVTPFLQEHRIMSGQETADGQPGPNAPPPPPVPAPGAVPPAAPATPVTPPDGKPPAAPAPTIPPATPPQ